MARPSLLVRIALLALVLFASMVVAEQPSADPAALARQAIEAPIGFPVYVFDGSAFPAPMLEPRQKYQDLFGPFTIKATFFNQAFEEVTAAASPGAYAAIVEVKPERGAVIRRYFTLCRTALKVAPAARFDPNSPVDLAVALGVNPGLLTDQSEVIAKRWGDRPFERAATDPGIGRLIGGLTRSKPGTGPTRTDTDAIAVDRQWWVAFKRHRWGLDRTFDKPVARPVEDEKVWLRPVARGTDPQAGVVFGLGNKLDRLCKEWAADDDQPFAVCVARRGVIVLHAAYGTRDGKPMEVTTKSWMASVTKSMATSLLMMLVDQGLVGLDDPVSKYLPPLRDLPQAKPLLIRHLPTHTAGLAGWPNELSRDELPDLEERVALAYPHLKVGQEWAYNGQSYALMGKVIEAVSGEALPQFYRKHLLEPLGCDHTDVSGTHADALSVPLDMAQFGQMLMNRGIHKTNRYFRDEVFAQMLPRPLVAELGPDAKKVFGLGLDGTPERFGHGAASAALFQVDATEKLVVVITRNRAGKNQGKYQGKFLELLRANLVKLK